MWIIPPCAVADMNLLTPLRNDVVCEKNTALLKNSLQIDAIFPPVLLTVNYRFFRLVQIKRGPSPSSRYCIWISPHIREFFFDASGDPYGSFNRKCERFRLYLPVIAVRVRCQATLCILLECFLDHVHLDTWRQIRHHSDGFPTDQARWIPNCGEWILFEGVFLAIISFSQWIVHWDRQRWRDGWGKQLSLNPVNHMTAQKRQQAAILRSEAPSLKTWFIRDKVRDSHSIRLWLLAIALLMCRAQSFV